MSSVYISIEKNIEVFEYYKTLWGNLGIKGIMVGSMTEGIEKAIEIEKSKIDELYFIDIVADDIDYMPQLAVLHEATAAPILIATSNYNEDEHHAALYNGADFYAPYCDNPEKNVNGLIAAINSIDRRTAKNRLLSDVKIYGGIMLAPSYRNEIFVNGKEITLHKIEFDILYFMMENRGKTLPYARIYEAVWETEYDGAARSAVWAAVRRLRDSLRSASGGTDYIETVRDVGYRFRLISDK